MSDLEQRIKEAAQELEMRGIIGADSLREALDALLVEKDARLEQVCNQLNSAMIGLSERQNQFERMGDLCDRAIAERDEWKRIAERYREQDRSQSDCDEHVDHQDCDDRCDICKAYDALVKGE